MGTRKRMAVSVRTCGICDQELPHSDYNQAQGGGANKDVVQLSCKHLFHTFCVRGGVPRRLTINLETFEQD